MDETEAVHCGNASCATPIARDLDATGARVPCPACGSTTRAGDNTGAATPKAARLSVNLHDEIEVSDRLDIVAKGRDGRRVAERASASSRMGNTSSGVDLDAGTYLRGGQQPERTSTDVEETLAGQAIARALSVEDKRTWDVRHVGAGGNLVDVELTCEASLEEVQVVWFETVALRDLKREQAIATPNRAAPITEIERLSGDAVDHKGSKKYPAHDRINLLLALHSPLPLTPTIVETCRAVIASMTHGYREVWLVDPTHAHRLTVRAANPRQRQRRP
jgi:hypothetical protein